MLNRHEVEPLKQFWTDSTLERFPDRTCHCADEIAAYFEEVLRAMPDWHIEIDGIDHFVVRDGRLASNFVVADQLQYGARGRNDAA